MENHSETEMKDIMDEMAEDLEQSRDQDDDLYRRRNSEGFPIGNKPLVYGALAVLVLVIFFALFLRDGKEVSKKDFDAIREKVDAIEKKMTKLESSMNQSNPLASQFDSMEKKLAKVDNLTKSLANQVGQLDRKIDQLQRPKASPSPASVSESRIHIVSRGETLYGIAKKYGLSLTQLRSLNKLNKSQDIYPGQKLVVAPGGQ